MKIEYKTQKERTDIIATQTRSSKVLLQEQNHKDGNFLIFADKYPEEAESETTEQLIERKIREMVKDTALQGARIYNDNQYNG